MIHQSVATGSTGGPGDSLGPEIKWVPIFAFTDHERISAELFLRGRLRDRLVDPEPIMRIRGVSTEPVTTGVQRLHNVPEGLLNRIHVTAITTVVADPPNPDAPPEAGRHALFQAGSFTVRGLAQFAVGVEPERHHELILKSKFWPVSEVTVEAAGSQASWRLPFLWVNRELVYAFYLG